jgi:hypothetical protein
MYIIEPNGSSIVKQGMKPRYSKKERKIWKINKTGINDD